MILTFHQIKLQIIDKMKNAICFSIALLTVGIFSSCEEETVDAINGKVASMASDGTNTSLEYDDQGRLTSYTQTGGGNTYQVTIQYGSGTVTWTESFTDSSGTASGTTIYSLNGQGYAVSDNGGTTYTYDSDGHLLSETSSSSSVEYTWSGGNQVSNVNSDSTGAAQYTQTKTYLADKEDYRDFGMAFLGKQSKNLINTVTDNYGATTYNATYTYEYDSKGRVSKETVAYQGSSNPSVTTYTYQD